MLYLNNCCCSSKPNFGHAVVPRMSFPVISETVSLTSLLPAYITTLGKKIDMAEQSKDL